MKVDDLRNQLVRLIEWVSETYGWTEIMSELYEVSEKERNSQKGATVYNELDRRFDSAYDEMEAFLQSFFKDEVEVEPPWENQDRVIESITRIATQQLLGSKNFKVTEKVRTRLRKESKQIFLYAKVFGPILKLPGEEKRAWPSLKTGEFIELTEESIWAADFQGIWEGVDKIMLPLASEEDPSTMDLYPKNVVRNGAPETIGFSDAGSLVYTVVSRCSQCGRKFLSLGVGVPPRCPCESEGDSTSGDETVHPLARGVVSYPMFDPLDLEDSIRTGEIWRTTQKKAREMITRCRTPTGHTFNRYEGGGLLSIFAGLLCIISGVEVTPSNIARAATEEEYRNRLLKKAKRNSMRVANKLKGREKVRKIAVAFWS
ncbi:hypothetical protein AKJ41_06110 [candidate division MSBL1 archaeon SCGC-AAA259O05]|uniref:Uncharacterized protein n=1 Tax=candidate division MSBL1 archaeon SCGC-AAA259O05 TaxID=1698271 RepID=A0A133UXU9_9EURY|nr:hypothetical protein AKJ41_06110 [candidate division MSBL1 archaeon SCGC-AAA259O05]